MRPLSFMSLNRAGKMKRLGLILMAFLVNLSAVCNLSGQNLVITNARIIDGTDRVISRGSVVVRDGKIASVSESTASLASASVIDAKGMTVMPGFIDSHRHVIQGDPALWLKELAATRMQEYLDAGFTTIFSLGDPLEQILELRRRLSSGGIKGPRLMAVGRGPLARSAGVGRGGGDTAPIGMTRP